MNPSYIATNTEELFEQASPQVQDMIQGDDVNNSTAVLGKIYKLPVNSYVALSNLISFILIGALKPEDVPRAFVDILHLSEEDAIKMAQDLDTSILEKARIKILGKSSTDMVELTFQEGRSEEDLRKEIMDTTKRESALIKEQVSVPSTTPTLPKKVTAADSEVPQATVLAPQGAIEKKVSTAPGSRSQLLEQLQVLDTIPNDEEIAARLTKIQEQISSMDDGKGTEGTPSVVPLQNYMLGEKADKMIEAEAREATYSKAPTKYNVDPYRETAE